MQSKMIENSTAPRGIVNSTGRLNASVKWIFVRVAKLFASTEILMAQDLAFKSSWMRGRVDPCKIITKSIWLVVELTYLSWPIVGARWKSYHEN